MASENSTQKTLNFGVLICAFNEELSIAQVVKSSLLQNPSIVLVVDDASSDNTFNLASDAGATVLRNMENLGKGACLRRGFEYLKQKNLDAVIVLDGDGQHDPAEIQRFLDAYDRTKIPILIGNRMADTRNMPRMRRWTNRTVAWVLNRLVKIYIPDPPCGYRFYRTDVLPFIMSDLPRFAFEFDILVHAALRHVRIDSVRISAIYNRNRRSNFAPVRDVLLFLSVVRHHFILNLREGRFEKV